MIYGYARVSTAGQAKDGNSLEAQNNALKAAGAQMIYSDHFTGKSMARPELDKLLTVLRDGDTLIVTKLDRIARSTVGGCELVNSLLERGVTVNILNMGIMDNTPTSKLIRSVFFAFAEFERDMIIQRTQEGKAIARQRPDYHEGRESIDVPAFPEYYDRVQRGEVTVTQACKELNVSRSWWYKKAREREELKRSLESYSTVMTAQLTAYANGLHTDRERQAAV